MGQRPLPNCRREATPDDARMIAMANPMTELSLRRVPCCSCWATGPTASRRRHTAARTPWYSTSRTAFPLLTRRGRGSLLRAIGRGCRAWVYPWSCGSTPPIARSAKPTWPGSLPCHYPQRSWCPRLSHYPYWSRYTAPCGAFPPWH